MNQKSKRELYATYHYKCSKCNTRHPKKVDKCFVCGSTQNIVHDPIKEKIKNKSSLRGASLKINL